MEGKVLEILESICGTDEVKENLDLNLFEDGLLDSLGIIELLLQLEETLGVKIEPTEIERETIETPKKIIDYINNRK